MITKPSNKVLWIIALALLALILFLDQYSKHWIDTRLPIREVHRQIDGDTYLVTEYKETPDSLTSPDKPGIEVIPNFFYIVHVVNRGAAWGIFHGKLNFLTGISAIALLGMLIFFNKICEGHMERVIGLGLLMGGTMGNLVDRMDLIKRASGIHGVVDFISFRINLQSISKTLEYPSFNIADSGICVGVAILCLSMFFRPDKNGECSPLAVAIKKRWAKWRGYGIEKTLNETA